MERNDTESYDLSMNDMIFNASKQASPQNPVPGPSSAGREDRLLALMNAREAAAYLRISLSTLHRMEIRGQLRALRTPGGHRRYTVAMLNECLEHSEDIPME